VRPSLLYFIAIYLFREGRVQGVMCIVQCYVRV